MVHVVYSEHMYPFGMSLMKCHLGMIKRIDTGPVLLNMGSDGSVRGISLAGSTPSAICVTSIGSIAVQVQSGPIFPFFILSSFF